MTIRERATISPIWYTSGKSENPPLFVKGGCGGDFGKSPLTPLYQRGVTAWAARLPSRRYGHRG